jgi:hypothetical protein
LESKYPKVKKQALLVTIKPEGLSSSFQLEVETA